MERSAFKKGGKMPPVCLVFLMFTRFSGGIFPLLTVCLWWELRLSVTVLGWLLVAEICGVGIGFFSASYPPFSAHSKPLYGWLFLLFGHLFTGCSSRVLWLALARLLVGFGCFCTENSVLVDVLGEDSALMVVRLAWYRATIVISMVAAPFLGAILLMRRGAQDTAYMLAFVCAVLGLLLIASPSKSQNTHPVSGDIFPEGSGFTALFGWGQMLALFLRGAAALFAIGVALFVFAASQNLLIAGLVMSLLRFIFWLCKSAIFL